MPTSMTAAPGLIQSPRRNSGLPIVSTHAAAIGEFIEDATNGLLVAPGAPDELAVALELLVREGVPGSDISVVALGEGQPMVPTADGVREAQNRRVEIVLR